MTHAYIGSRRENKYLMQLQKNKTDSANTLAIRSRINTMKIVSSKFIISIYLAILSTSHTDIIIIPKHRVYMFANVVAPSILTTLADDAVHGTGSLFDSVEKSEYRIPVSREIFARATPKSR